tara:strand:- start:629 stop:988 length:360 start_codon:yes stop_codon:yes gene_type:complete
MKKVAIIVLALGLMGSAIALADRVGWGDRVTVTVTPQIIGSSPGFGGYVLTIVNEGAVPVYCLVNCNDVAAFNTRYTAGTTVEIPVGDTFSFTTYGKTVIRKLYIRTASSTCDVLLATY